MRVYAQCIVIYNESSKHLKNRLVQKLVSMVAFCKYFIVYFSMYMTAVTLSHNKCQSIKVKFAERQKRQTQKKKTKKI